MALEIRARQKKEPILVSTNNGSYFLLTKLTFFESQNTSMKVLFSLEEMPRCLLACFIAWSEKTNKHKLSNPSSIRKTNLALSFRVFVGIFLSPPKKILLFIGHEPDSRWISVQLRLWADSRGGGEDPPKNFPKLFLPPFFCFLSSSAWFGVLILLADPTFGAPDIS